MGFHIISSIWLIWSKHRKKGFEKIITENKLLVMIRNVLLIMFFIEDKTHSVCLYADLQDWAQRILGPFNVNLAFLVHILIEFFLNMSFLISLAFIYHREK